MSMTTMLTTRKLTISRRIPSKHVSYTAAFIDSRFIILYVQITVAYQISDLTKICTGPLGHLEIYSGGGLI